MNPIISIIVPIYNAEKYLSDCLESIICQTYTNLEIILVDDASTDSSPEICREYEKKDERIRLIVKPQNGGVSQARNDGMKQASGTYINFFDSDDWMAPEMIEKLYHAIEKKGADMSMCSHTRITPDGKVLKHCTIPDSEAMDKIQVYKLLCAGRLTCFVGPKLYRRELFHKVRFLENKMYEDVFLFPQIMECCEKISSVSEELVLYRIHSDSFTNSSYRIQHMDIIEADLAFYKYALEHKIDFLAEEMKIRTYLRLIVAIKRCRFRAEEQLRIRQLRKQAVSVCGFHRKYTAMVYVYYWMRKLHFSFA